MLKLGKGTVAADNFAIFSPLVDIVTGQGRWILVGGGICGRGENKRAGDRLFSSDPRIGWRGAGQNRSTALRPGAEAPRPSHHRGAGQFITQTSHTIHDYSVSGHLWGRSKTWQSGSRFVGIAQDSWDTGNLNRMQWQSMWNSLFLHILTLEQVPLLKSHAKEHKQPAKVCTLFRKFPMYLVKCHWGNLFITSHLANRLENQSNRGGSCTLLILLFFGSDMVPRVANAIEYSHL